MSRYGDASLENEESRSPRKNQRRTILFTHAGERVRPVHKPFNRAGCQWVDGVGWVWNPTGRRIA